MDAGEGIVEKFLAFEKMVQIGAGKMFTSATIAVWVNRFGIGFVFFITDIDPFVFRIAFEKVPVIFWGYFAGIKGTVSGESGGGDTVKHIDAKADGRKDV